MRRSPLAVLLALVGSSLGAQPKLVVTPRDATFPALDSLYNVSGQAFDAIGRRSPASTVTWRVRPAGAIAVRPDSATKGQKATIAGVQPGTAYAIASWAHSNGTTYRDSMRVVVTIPATRKVSVYAWRFLGIGRGFVLDSVIDEPFVKGRKRCMYVVTWDKRGQPVTGKPRDLRSTDSNIQAFVDALAVGFLNQGPAAPLPDCPDTTVDPSKIRRPT